MSVKRTYPTPDSGLSLFNTLVQQSWTIGSVAYSPYTVFVWSRLSALVELSTRYSTPDTTVEIGSMCGLKWVKWILPYQQLPAYKNTKPILYFLYSASS